MLNQKRDFGEIAKPKMVEAPRPSRPEWEGPPAGRRKFSDRKPSKPGKAGKPGKRAHHVDPGGVQARCAQSASLTQ